MNYKYLFLIHIHKIFLRIWDEQLLVYPREHELPHCAVSKVVTQPLGGGSQNIIQYFIIKQ